MSEEAGNGPMTVNAFTNKWCPRGDMQDHDCQMGKDLEGIIESLTRKASLCERIVKAARAFAIDPKDDDGIEDNSCGHRMFELLSEFDREAKK